MLLSSATSTLLRACTGAQGPCAFEATNCCIEVWGVHPLASSHGRLNARLHSVAE